MNKFTGNLLKMTSFLNQTVEYSLPVGKQSIALNSLLGKTVMLNFTGVINCINCGRVTKKSFSQGYCYPCMMSLAACDICIVKPELCHFDKGTCREPEWAMSHCMQPHFVYLANSSGVKVGITRESQIPTRWIDQGAIQALPIAKAQTRYQVGLLEVTLASQVADKTDWRRMLKNDVVESNLADTRDKLFEICGEQIEKIKKQFDGDQIALIENGGATSIHYPVTEYPQKIKALNFDKTPEISGQLMGIKGQYLILDTGVLNIRKFSGYEISFQA